MNIDHRKVMLLNSRSITDKNTNRVASQQKTMFVHDNKNVK